MSKKIDIDKFPKIQKNEQVEILNIVREFSNSILNQPEEWIYISSHFQDEGNTHMQISSQTSSLDGDTIYLRFGKYNYDNKKEKRIVIARMSFKNTRNGNGTALLKKLCEIAEKYTYESIEVEQPNPNCKAFMKKLGFTDGLSIQTQQLIDSIKIYEMMKQA